jgi:hypothetical protein
MFVANPLAQHPVPRALSQPASKMKSALTASLAGGTAAPPAAKARLGKLGTGTLPQEAFPCIPYADELDGISRIEEDVELQGATEALVSSNWVGSAPQQGLLLPDGTQLVSISRVFV